MKWNCRRIEISDSIPISITAIERLGKEDNMDYRIREIKQEEYAILDEFLYEAIFIPDGVEAPPKSIIRQPELQVYVSDFGKKDDHCLVAEVDGEIIGTVWTRIMNDYGHVDDTTPSFAISLYKDFRGRGGWNSVDERNACVA